MARFVFLISVLLKERVLRDEHCVAGQVVPDVSNDGSAFFCRVKQAEGGGTTILRNIGAFSPVDIR